MINNQFDAIVIGSGISGGWAAKELTEKGLKVIMLERGRNIEHIKDYVNANKESWDYLHRGERTQELIRKFPVLKRDFPLNELNTDFWASDQDNPYTEIKRFDWFRGYQVGGRSLMWGRLSLRFSDLDFEANAKDGIAIDWPVRYKEIAPWYDYVEKFAGISGDRDGIPHLPDGIYQPAIPLTCVEEEVKKRMHTYYKNTRHLIVTRSANITQPLQDRVGCQYRNKCWLGCPFGGYFSTQSSTLPAAIKTGNLTLRPWSIVTKILYDKDKKKATGVEVLDAETNKTYTYYAKIIFLNASTLNSAWILMNSATDIWPNGLGSSSGELGHNIMDHHLDVGAEGIVEGFEDKYTFGRRPNGFYIPRFRNILQDKRNYIRGFGYEGGSGRDNWRQPLPSLNIGGVLKDSLSEPGAWKLGMGGFGEILPYHDNKITLDKNKKDKWGLPVLAMDCELKENEIKMRVDMKNDALEILTNAGLKQINAWDNGSYIGRGIHEMGSARMGKDPKTSVLNKFNQIWDATNVFVTDGSFMTSSSCHNPSLSYMAFTARAVDYAVQELKKKNL